VYRDIPADLLALVEPIAADYGFELVDAELQRGQPGLVRITVDNSDGDGRVPVDSLATLSREIETQLDAAEWMVDSYRLELTSPGLDRVLGREKDFSAACADGSEVKIKTRRSLDGRRRFTGVLIAFEARTVRLASDSGELSIPFDEIEKANTVYKFTSADFKERAKK
jgi:ribosome maturation factor RimP